MIRGSIILKMKSTLTIQQLTEEAAKHEEIAALYRSIGESLQKLNPNIELLISEKKAEPQRAVIPAEQHGANDPAPAQDSPSKLETLKQVLRDSRKPLTKTLIKIEMERLGHEITVETLGSYLSRNKNTLFKNPKRGYWKLIEQTATAEPMKAE